VTILAPLPTTRRSSRFVRLFGGLVLYGFSDGLLVRANLGLDPWDVLHQGLSRTFGLEIGTWSIIVGAFVLLMWMPLRRKPGVGTVCNIVMVGAVMNVTINELPVPRILLLRCIVLVTAVALNGVATGAYIGAELGAGPRDGLTLAIASRGVSIRVVRTSIELTVLIGGWFLGGTVDIGTLVYALMIGPITHLTIPRFRLSRESD